MTVNPHYRENVPEYKIDVDSFTQFNWKSADARDLWQEYMSGMKRAKWEAEWRSVFDDDTDRKAAIIHIDNHNREKWLKRIGEYDLHYRDIRYSQPYNGYAHEHKPTSKSNPERITYSVISENSDIADKMEEAEMEFGGHERHDTVGKLLGFPDCCRNFFNEVWVDKQLFDPIYEAACNTSSVEKLDDDGEHLLIEDYHESVLPIWRYHGINYLTHLPCSFDCDHSRDVARNRYDIMSECGMEESANAIHNWLKEPAMWSGYHSICNTRNKFATSASRTSNYWGEKKLVLGEEHDAKY